MTKRLVEIEDTLLEEARSALGTDTIKATVTTALQQAVVVSRRRRLIDDEALQRVAEATKDLSDPEVMSRAWR